MSIAVLSRVMGNFHPESEVGDRLVLVVLADAAHDDGITWVSQEDIAFKARLSVRHVGRCIKALDDRMEIEIRKAQRGRRRINVYRVAVAPADPDYDRLPFTLADPFTANGLLTGDLLTGPTKGQDTKNDRPCPVVDDEDVRSSPPTTGHDVRSSKPPTLRLYEGRNIGVDALADACGIIEGDPRWKECGAALGDSKSGDLGIRSLFWQECLRYVQQNPQHRARLVEVMEEPERFERALEAAIQTKAALYRDVMDGAILTPSALRKWWVSIENQRVTQKRGLTPEEIRRMGDAL